MKPAHPLKKNRPSASLIFAMSWSCRRVLNQIKVYWYFFVLSGAKQETHSPWKRKKQGNPKKEFQ